MRALPIRVRLAKSPMLAASLMLVTSVVPVLAAAPATCDPVAFFTGATTGKGALKKVFSSPQAVHVTSFGTVRRDGALVLDQTVRIAGEKESRRQWLLRPSGAAKFTGTISDAQGPVTAAVSGDRLTIRYTMNTGMAVDQVLTIAANGQSARNTMKFRKFGIVAATLEETIRRE